jgi:hypothetical protein
MRAQKQFAPLEVLEVATDGVVGDPKMVGQFIYRHLAFGLHQLKQLLVTAGERCILIFVHKWFARHGQNAS